MMLFMTLFEREAHRRIFQDATHLLRPSTARTVPIQKYHAGWNEKNAVVQRITLRDARTVPVASPSAMILQLKKENYHLALFTFKGVSSNDMKKMPWCKESRCVMHGQSL